MKRALWLVALLLLLPTSALAQTTNSRTMDGSGNPIPSATSTPTGGSRGIVVRHAGTLDVSATDLDIRNLAHTQDSIRIGDGVDLLAVNADGSINIVATGTVTANQGGTWTVQSAQSGTWTVQATQSGTWNIRLQDAAGNGLASSTTTPGGSEQALIVRPIPSGTQTVSGTVTANAGTNLNTSLLALDATLTGGNMQSILRGASKGGTSAANVTVSSVDANTNAVDVFIRGGAGAGGTSAQDNTTFTTGASAVTPSGFMFKSGSAPAITDGDVGIPMMNSSRQILVACPTCPGGTGGTALTDKAGFTEGSGSMTPIGGVLNDTISADPTEDQAAAVRITAKRGLHTNLRNASGTEIATAGNPIRVDPTGTTTQPVSIPGTVTVSGTLTANLGTTAGGAGQLALDATLARAQGSTTSGQTGPIVQGAVTTSAPSYTTALTNPLSLSTAGDLRVVATTGLADRTASGNIAGAGQSVAVSLQGLQGVSFAVTGTWTATLRCQVTSDGATWEDVDSWKPGTESHQVDVVGNGQYSCDVPGGMGQARVTANAYTSGTAAIALRASAVPAREMHAFDRPDGQSLPNHSVLVGGTDGTNIRSLYAFDVDSGGGTQYVAGVSIRLSNSGGSVEGGNASNPLRIDPTGSTVQPVSGTVTTVTAGTAASGTAASGNPVQVGGVFNSTAPTVTNGQAVALQTTNRGSLIVATGGNDGLAVDTELPLQAVLADAVANPTTVTVGSAGLTFNGTTWDRARSIAAATNTAGTGIAAVGIVGQFDDTSTATVTENQFAPLRITATRDLRVTLVDSGGSPVSVGGGTQYARDTAAGAADQMNMAGAVRKDTAASLVDTDGDRSPLQVDNTGSLWINCRTGCAGGTQYTEDAAAAANPIGTALNLIRDDARSGSLTTTDGDNVAARGTNAGELYVKHVDAITVNAGTGNFGNNLTQIAGAAVDGNSGAKSGGTLRVVIATDQPALTNKLLVTPDANSAVNLGQVGGSSVSTVASGVAKVGIADSGGTAFLSAANALNSTGGGIQAAQIVGQFDDTSPTAITENQFGNLRMSANRNLYGTVRDAAGNERGANVTASNELLVSVNNATLAATQSGTWTVQPGNTANSTPWLVTDNGAASGGATTCYLTSAASTNSTSCKGSAGQIYGISVVNTTATLYYLRLYNSSSAPTCSSATGFIRSIPIPASTTGSGITEFRHVGAAYGTGIGFCLTGGGSSTDNTNAATGVYLTLEYK